MRLVLTMLAAIALPTWAGEPKPEITRADSQPQAVGAVHALRTIPEACARLEGMFTGDAAQPYRFAAVRTSARCQPRARFVDAAKAQTSVAAGWKLNELIRVPNAACPTQRAVVRVWRKPADVAPPKLDAQGRARIYLDEQRLAAAGDRLAALPMFTAEMSVEGRPCE